MKVLTVRWVLLALPWLLACAARDRSPGTGNASDSVTADAPSDSALSTSAARLRYWSFAETFDTKRDSLNARLGPPKSVGHKPHQNIHDPTQVDTIVTAIYGDLTLQFYGGQGREMLFSISLATPRQGLPLAVGVGSTDSSLTSIFGSPDYTHRSGDSTQLVFTVPNEEQAAENQLQFMLLNQRVARINWAFYID